MNPTKCEICGKEGKELRLGVCWECATTESIIADGTDMYEKGPKGLDIPATTAMEKVLFLREKGLLK